MPLETDKSLKQTCFSSHQSMTFFIDCFQNKNEKVSQHWLFEKKEEKSVMTDFFQFFFQKSQSLRNLCISFKVDVGDSFIIFQKKNLN